MNQPTDNERMRRMFDDAVSDVEPRHSLDQIRARTATRQHRRGWFLGAGAAAVATAATITAVALLGEGPGATNAPEPGVAEGSVEPVEPVPVFYVGDTGQGPRLFRELHRVGTGSGVLPGALSQAVSASPDDPDYRTPWPAGTEVVRAERADGRIVVGLDLPGDRRLTAAGVGAEELIGFQQLVHTAQAATKSADPVRIVLDGQRVDTLLSLPLGEYPTQGDPRAQVWIDQPAEGEVVRSGFEVSGLANAFEANVQWELMRGDQVVKSGFTTAEECCTMAPYSFTVQAPPGSYTLVVHDSDPSDGEGFPPWRDTKEITVEQ